MSIYTLLVAALVALAGCSKSEPPPHEQGSAAQNQGEIVAAKDLELGRRIYNFRCYYCHGYSGNAHTLAATFLTPKPVDFTSISPKKLSRATMIKTVQSGSPSTAMMSFTSILKPDEIEAVVDFVRQEFMIEKAVNTRYHTVENGWIDHKRYADAYPFALGEIPLDTPWEQLTPKQAAGKRLFMTSCVSCHDRARENNEDTHWESSAVSYPRNGYIPGGDQLDSKKANVPVDAMTSATPFHLHDRAPQLTGLTESERRGEALFQHNCAFCHAADGTARNWVGSFMEPHPRNLTHSAAMDSMTRTRLRTVIRQGLPGTSMPAWKSVLTEQQITDVIAYVARAFHPLPP